MIPVTYLLLEQDQNYFCSRYWLPVLTFDKTKNEIKNKTKGIYTRAVVRRLQESMMRFSSTLFFKPSIVKLNRQIW